MLTNRVDAARMSVNGASAIEDDFDVREFLGKVVLLDFWAP